jgi:CrcB protein
MDNVWFLASRRVGLALVTTLLAIWLKISTMPSHLLSATPLTEVAEALADVRKEDRLDRYAMIALGGALGAIARYQFASMIQARIPAGFPWGTFIVNISGCLVMGIVTTLLTERLVAHPNWRFLIPIGFIGAYTTFSTFELETFRAVNEGAWLTGGVNVVGSVLAGYLALWLGVVLTRVI